MLTTAEKQFLSQFENSLKWGTIQSYPGIVSSATRSKLEAEKLAKKVNVFFNEPVAKVFKGVPSECHYVLIPRHVIPTNDHFPARITDKNLEINYLLDKHPTEHRIHRILNPDQVKKSLIKNNQIAQKNGDKISIERSERKNPSQPLKATVSQGELSNFDWGYSLISQSSFDHETIDFKLLQFSVGEKKYSIPVFILLNGQESSNQKKFSNHLFETLKQKLSKKFSQLNQEELNSSPDRDCAIYNSLTLSFVETFKQDDDIPKEHDDPIDEDKKITATLCLFFNHSVWTACSGDSQAILSQFQSTSESVKKIATVLCKDRKVASPKKSYEEKLTLTSPLTKVNFRPDITKFEIIANEERSFLVIASKGFWDVFSPNEVARKINELGNEAWTCKEIAEGFAKRACIKENHKDISVLIIEVSTPDYFKNWELKKPLIFSPPLSICAINFLQKKLPQSLLKYSKAKNEKEFNYLLLPIGKITKKSADLFPTLHRCYIRDKIFSRNRRIYSTDDGIEKKLEKQLTDANTNQCLIDNKDDNWDNHVLRICPNDYTTENFSPTFKTLPYVEEGGIASTQGDRESMEDAHIADVLSVKINGKEREIPLFGIFDGHGGKSFSQFLSTDIKKYLEKKINHTFKKENLSDLALLNLLKLTFVELGSAFTRPEKDSSGSTATIALIIEDHLWVANVGDSRTIVSLENQVIALSEDASLNSKKFIKSIHNRGQIICLNKYGVKRVNGLNMSHAAGHDEFTSGINPRPKITKYPLINIEKNTYLVLACDGLYDVASSTQVSQTIQEKASLLDSTQIALTLVQKAYATSEDNISVMVIKLKKNA